MAAGDIARRLKVPQNTLSFQIAILSRARLLASRLRAKTAARSSIPWILKAPATSCPS
ncbi:MAG: helix-turn-helix domain-containing protein [Methyloceanibacter sp.]